MIHLLGIVLSGLTKNPSLFVKNIFCLDLEIFRKP
ncbi:TPA: hypothetical protein JAZ42_00315 [Legionella pneumophila]|nr:hypothetical protein [Legionella pneumophila]HAT7767489.1 hypothetical protein [Legionella pneumophila]HAT8719252.1 hypothetical protein [Legionella pneumophila]HAU1271537.1 hypothetical protein [Legionella pneumophila]HAU1508496.1 hypothetical protein [Legionella pneumophila]